MGLSVRWTLTNSSVYVWTRYIISLYNQGRANQCNHWSLEVSLAHFKLAIYGEMQFSKYRSCLMFFEMSKAIWNINILM